MKIPKLSLFVLLLFASLISSGQNVTPEATNDGVRLRKVTPDTAKATGAPFHYQLQITIPPGLDSIRVLDILPAGLVFHSIGTIPASLGAPVVTTPAPNTSGPINLRWGPSAVTRNGNIFVNVSFPNGITCNNLVVANRLEAVWWRNGVVRKLETEYVRTRAIAVNPWRIEKKVLGLANVGGACPYRTSDTVITYNIRVFKANDPIFAPDGQLNLVNAVVRDTLPPGASLVGSSSCVTQVGNVLIWNIDSLAATVQFNAVNCQFSVSYPTGTTTVINSATLSGDLGPRANPCGSFSTSSKVCVTIVPPEAGGIFNKTVSTTGQPGCGGKYTISVKNTGTVAATTTIIDTIPANLNVGVITVNPAGALNYFYDPVTHILTASTPAGSSIGQGLAVSIVVNFIIDSSTPLNVAVTNCANFTLSSSAGTVNGRRCVTFNTNVPPAIACIWKQVCNKKIHYNIGDTIRYRLRVQNTGGIALTGGIIRDTLSPNLQYIGNVTFDSAMTWNTPCKKVTTFNWQNVSVSSSNNIVNINLPSIPPTCQTAFYGNCGAYGSPLVPFYFIEFDVRVADTAALGNTPNRFWFKADSIQPFSSNTDFVNIAGYLGITAVKEVSVDGTSWSNNVASTPGALVNYRLRSNIEVGSVGQRHMSFVDLLPLNNNGLSDHFLLTTCGARGSAFNMSYVATLAASPAVTGYNNAGAYARVNLFNPTPFTDTLFSGCGTSTNLWGAGLSGGERNVGFYFGSTGIGSGAQASVTFSAKVAPDAKVNTTACNTFALNSYTKYLFNTSTVASTAFVPSLPLESDPACVTVTNVVKPCIDKLDYKIECLGKNALGFQQYAIDISGVNIDPAGTNIALSSPEGSVSPNNFTVPVGSFVASTVFTDVAPANNPIHIFITLLNADKKICRDTLEVKLPECREEVDCCTGFVHEFLEQSVRYDVDKDQVYLVGCVKAGPAKIQNFGYTIVAAERQVFCEGRAFEPERIYGDIVYGSLNMSMYPSIAQTLDYFTREIKWGKYQECYNLMDEPLCYRSILAFPAPPLPCSACYDVLTFSVRYTFTDCNCLTCDTVITYSIKRQCKEEIAKLGGAAPEPLSAGMLSLQKLNISRAKPNNGAMRLNNRQ